MAIDDAGQSSNDVGVRDESENSTTTMEIKIKMLDSSTHTIHVKKDVAIPTLKEQLALVVGVPAQQQRLIFRGKVLKDDHLLSSYNVEDGDSLHLVVRQIMEPSAVNSEGVTSSQESQDGASMPSRARPTQVTHNVVLGTINITNAGEGGLPDLNRIVSAVLNSVGSGNTSFESAVNGGVTMGVSPPNVHATAPNSTTRPDVANGGQPPQTAANNLPTQMSMEVVPDALETLSLFLNRVHANFMENGFVREGTSDHSPEFHSSSTSDAGNIGHIFPSATSPATPRQSLTPAALGNIIHRVQEVLTNQAEAAFSRLSGQLENETTLTDAAARGEVQSAAVWTGNMMQQLGALLMELGRTTLTLRMGQSPAEAVVNSGPAVFISPIGPNPIMVQPLPFQTGFPFGDFRVQVPQTMPGMTRPPSFTAVGPRGVNIQIHARDLGSVLASGALPSNMQLPSQILAGLASGAPAQRPEQAQTGESGSAEQSPPGPEGAGGPNLQVLPGVVQGAIMIIQENGTSRVVPIAPRAAPLSNNMVTPVGAETRPNSGGFTPINAIFQQQMDPLLTHMRPVQLGTVYNQATNPIAPGGPIANIAQHQPATATESTTPLGITITVPLHLAPQLAESQPQQIVTSRPGVEPVSRTTEISLNSTETQGVISCQPEIVEGGGPEMPRNQQSSINLSIANGSESLINAESADNIKQTLHEGNELSSDGLQNSTREQIETPLEENDSKCKASQSSGVDVIPAGLGLGSLPALPLKPCRRPKAKHRELPQAEQSKAESSAQSSEVQDPTVNLRRRSDDSKVHLSQGGKGSARVDDDGQMHSRSGTEQLVSSPFPSNMLRGGLTSDGGQSRIPSDAFGNMMGQLMRSPIMGTFVNQVAQSMGEAQSSPNDPENPQIGEMLGGLDIASMLQQTLPLMSQLFEISSPVGQSDHSSLGALGEVELNHRQHSQLESSRATTGESSQVKLQEIAEKVQNGERPEDIFRSVAEIAAKYVLSSSSSDEIVDLARALAQTTGLADAYMSLLCHDLATQLATEAHQNGASQSPHASQHVGPLRSSERTEEEAKRF